MSAVTEKKTCRYTDPSTGVILKSNGEKQNETKQKKKNKEEKRRTEVQRREITGKGEKSMATTQLGEMRIRAARRN